MSPKAPPQILRPSPTPSPPHKGAGSHVFDISEKQIFLCQMTSDHILAINCFLVMRTHNLQSITT